MGSDLQYNINNKDLLTSIIDLTKGFWIDKVNAELRKSIIPKINEQVSTIVNGLIKDVYKTELEIKDQLNLKVNLRCEAFSVSHEFIRLVLNGHIQSTNTTSGKKITSENYGALADLSNDIDERFVYIQVSDWILQCAIEAYFQNNLHFEIPLDTFTLKKVEVDHYPGYEKRVQFLRKDTQDPETKELTVMVCADFAASIHQKLLPQLNLGAKVSLRVNKIIMKGLDPKDNKIHFLFTASDIQVLELYNSAMEPVNSFKTDVTGAIGYIRDKVTAMVFNQDIAIDKIKIGNYSTVIPLNLFTFKDSFLFKAQVDF